MFCTKHVPVSFKSEQMFIFIIPFFKHDCFGLHETDPNFYIKFEVFQELMSGTRSSVFGRDQLSLAPGLMNAAVLINSECLTFTSLTGKGIIMIARCSVPADETQFFLLTWSWALLLLSIAAVKTVSIKTALRG